MTNYYKRLQKTIYLFSLTIISLALMVIVGWHIDNRALIQIAPQFAPMQYNTAICFLLSSIGCCALTRKPTISVIFGVLVLIISSATMAQYITNINFGIDELIIKDVTITTKVSHPGRMAPNTALCFILTALSLLVHRHSALLISFASTMFLLAFLALIGYIINFEGLYGIGTLTRMAIHTAIGFVGLSICFFSYYRLLTIKQPLDRWRLIPFIVFIAITTITFFTWHSVKEIHDQTNKAHFEELVNEKINALQKRFALYEQALLSGVGYIRGSSDVTRLEWKEYVSSLNMEEYLPGSNGIGYIEKVESDEVNQFIRESREDNAPEFTIHPKTNHKDKFVIKYIEPDFINNPAIGLDIGFEENRRSAAEMATDTGKITLTKKIELVQDQKRLAGFLLLAPVYEKGLPLNSVSERRKAIIGWVYSPFMARKFMADFKKIGKGQVLFDVYDGETIADKNLIYGYTDKSSNSQMASELTFQTTISLAQQNWTFVWTPHESYKSAADPGQLKSIIVIGMLLAALCSGLMYTLSMLYGASTQKAAEHQNRLKDIFDNTVDSIITIKESGAIDSINKACESLFGYLDNEIVGKNISLVIPKFTGQIGAILDKLSSQTATQETKARRKDGSLLSIELTISKIKTNNEHLFTGIIRDITGRKQIEKMKNEFISTVNHELRTPLTSIYTSIGLLRLKVADQIEDSGKRVLDIAHSNCERLLQLVNDILDIEKIAAGKMEYKLEDVDLIACVQDIVEQNQGYAVKYGVQFVIKSDFEKAYCNVDANRFTQALVNLLSNAAKFSPKGEEIIISLEAKEKNKLLLSVIDKGVGISANFQKKIFEKFSQENKPSTSSKGGTGLGLNITKSFIEAFKGEIGFDSVEGQGSTFYFILPISKKGSTVKKAQNND